MSDLTKHSQRHSSGIFGAHSDEKDGILLCTNGILSRLRWWRLKEIAFDIAGSLADIHSEPKLVCVVFERLNHITRKSLEHKNVNHVVR